MKVKIDESLSKYVAEVCSAAGHDAHTVFDEDLEGQPDPLILEAAGREGRILFTLDKGFGDIRSFPPGDHAGVILFRPPREDAYAIMEFVRVFLDLHSLEQYEGCTVVVESNRVRVRRS